VDTQWLEKNLNNKDLRIIHVASMGGKKEHFDMKHIPGSIYLGIGELMGAIGNGTAAPDKAAFETLMGKMGISNDNHVVVLGGGGENPFIAGAFWLMKYHGHNSVSILDGGVKKWMSENRKTTGDATAVKEATYSSSPNSSLYASAEHVLQSLNKPEVAIVDVRNTGEFTGTDNSTQNKRTGHIPGAIHLDFYTTNLNQDGTFKSVADLKAAYESKGVTKDKEVIIYCQGGIRAAHTHFVLQYMLGYPNVRNYVGSWGEWGNRVDFAKYPAKN
jgi:thiosulfate/3-mercaptopyruvate sulfurtransferase